MGKLNLNFSYTFNGKIWNIISHSHKELLLLETRQQDKFLATFSLLNTATGDLILKDIQFEEKWWIGASNIVDNNILFYTYPDQDNPEVKDIFSYDFVANKIRWKIEQKNIINVDTSIISVLTPGHEEVTYYNASSGEKVEAPKNVDGEKKNKMLEESFHYRQGNRHFETVSTFIKENIGKDAVKGIDYYQNEKVIVISYYYWVGNAKLDNDLLVMDHEGNQLLSTSLGSELSGISNDTFFVYYNKLIFVRNNTELLIHQLP